MIFAAKNYPHALFSLLPLLAALPAHAIDFQFEKDHCAAQEYQPVNPQSGGTQAGMFGLDDSAWAETGECVKIPIQELVQASTDIGVMTWKGVTRIASANNLPLQASQYLNVNIMYEASQNHLGCHTAQWPITWTGTIEEGTSSAPKRILIDAERVPGGNSNGAYIKKTSALIELLSTSASETSIHMRYEIQAPGQLADWALGAITDYFQYLTTVAGGGRAPGAIENPGCPNP